MSQGACRLNLTEVEAVQHELLKLQILVCIQRAYEECHMCRGPHAVVGVYHRKFLQQTCALKNLAKAIDCALAEPQVLYIKFAETAFMPQSLE